MRDWAVYVWAGVAALLVILEVTLEVFLLTHVMS